MVLSAQELHSSPFTAQVNLPQPNKISTVNSSQNPEEKRPIWRSAALVASGLLVSSFILGAVGVFAFPGLGELFGIPPGTLSKIIDQTTGKISLLALPQGHGGGIDADKLDGLHSTSFALKADFDAATGDLSKKINDLGVGLTASSQNATNVIFGTLSDLRLSANVALLDIAQTFTASKTFSAGLTVSGGVLTLPTGSITSSSIADGTVLDADIAALSGIKYSKLSLSGSVLGTDLASYITISTTGNLTTTGSGLITSAGLLTASNGFTLSAGTLTLPAGSISDIALSSNVPLKNAANTFLAGQTIASGGISVTGNSTITGTLDGITGLTASTVTLGTNPASSGTLRLPNAGSGYTRWRNAANTADVNYLYTSASDILTLEAPSGSYVRIQDGTSVGVNIGAGYTAIGTNPASTGAIRIPNNAALVSRNAANTSDLNLIWADGSDVTRLGGAAIQALAASSFSIGATPAATGTIRLPNAASIKQRNAGNTDDDQIWPLQTVSSCITSNPSMTPANTWVDGPSISLGPGTWYVSGQVLLSSSGTNSRNARLWDGTTNYATAQAAAGGYNASLPLSAFITLASTTTIKISAATDGASGQILGSIANPAVTGDGLASCIRAMKVGN